ncbi:hypothetical protein M728_005835 (plasmid) [Ensifer sp. WSM1721]
MWIGIKAAASDVEIEVMLVLTPVPAFLILDVVLDIGGSSNDVSVEIELLAVVKDTAPLLPQGVEFPNDDTGYWFSDQFSHPYFSIIGYGF